MFESIVVPVDLTDRNRDAVEMARELVSQEGRVFLLHVIETIPGIELVEERAFYAKLEKRALSHLEELSKLLGPKQDRFEAEVSYGPRAKTILEQARKLNADLIVVRSHRVGDETPSEG